jgi:hypothetical protein
MNILVLGARPDKYGFGASILKQLEFKEIPFRAISRSQINFVDTSWIERFDFTPYSSIIVNAFDYTNVRAQFNMFIALFEKLKNTNVQLVAIGSMAHYFKRENDYEIAKGDLHDFVVNIGKHSLEYQCKLVLFEPGAMENHLLRKPNYSFTYSTLTETAQALVQVMLMDQKFVSFAMRGYHVFTPVTGS